IDVAELPLVAQHPVAFFLFPFLLNFGGDSDLVAFDRHVDVVLLHARHFGMNQVTVLGFGHVHLDHYRRRCTFDAHGLEETPEQFVETTFGPWIVRDKVLHVVPFELLYYWLAHSPSSAPEFLALSEFIRCFEFSANAALAASLCSLNRRWLASTMTVAIRSAVSRLA